MVRGRRVDEWSGVETFDSLIVSSAMFANLLVLSVFVLDEQTASEMWMDLKIHYARAFPFMVSITVRLEKRFNYFTYT